MTQATLGCRSKLAMMEHASLAPEAMINNITGAVQRGECVMLQAGTDIMVIGEQARDPSALVAEPYTRVVVAGTTAPELWVRKQLLR